MTKEEWKLECWGCVDFCMFVCITKKGEISGLATKYKAIYKYIIFIIIVI